jgi:hypothetical protein
VLEGAVVGDGAVIAPNARIDGPTSIATGERVPAVTGA